MSRPTRASLGEKQTVVVKTMVADEVDDDLKRFARERGYGSVSDCVRELILVALYGEDFLASLHRERIASLYRKGAGTDKEAAPR